MKYILLGKMDGKWANDPERHIGAVNEKLGELKVSPNATYFTQGDVDFVLIVSAPTPDAVLSASLWYLNAGMGRMTSMPAFDVDEIDMALARARGASYEPGGEDAPKTAPEQDD